MDRTQYPDFKCARPVEREAMKRTPIYYPRETVFNVANLLKLAGSFLVGDVIGHLILAVL